MSQNSCCVPGCSVTIKDGIPLHRFPNPNVNAEKFNTWVSKIGGAVATMDNLDIYSNRRVCHKHFEEMHKYPRNRLCKLAIPVLYLPEQLHTESVTLPDLPSTSGYQRIPCEIPMRVQLFTKPDMMPALCSMSEIQKTSSGGQMTGHEQHIMKKEQNKNKSTKRKGSVLF
ncbi:hypothetical protein PYW08_006032 [Mythimna loreyi]|uniref:Uncharacterized protein n=1 Tax=Mythimna loreyi TaxID=667449 RepID=A0ACC2QLI4_9NEOP|nr:hypothetical protein PYW08_006032 [Mythimna loreyi]